MNNKLPMDLMVYFLLFPQAFQGDLGRKNGSQGQIPLIKKTYFKKNHANGKCTEIKLNQISS